MKEHTFPISLSSQTILNTYIVVGFTSFALPFLLGHPQLVVGSIVNAGLFLGSLYLPRPMLYSIIFFPSLAVLSRGIIFGPATPFLTFILPFIWLANSLLVFVFKKISQLKGSYWLAVVSASLVKYLFLYGVTLILFNLKIVPKIFLTSMGVFQLITALTGGLITFFIKNFYYDRITRA